MAIKRDYFAALFYQPPILLRYRPRGYRHELRGWLVEEVE